MTTVLLSILLSVLPSVKDSIQEAVVVSSEDEGAPRRAAGH